MSKELRAFRKICRNLNSYEFTDEYKKNKKLIETTLKNYEELTNKPVILYERTHGSSQALIDTICKNYKEIKITNLEDEKKLKALNEILALHDKWLGNEMSDFEFFTLLNEARDKYGLLEEVLS